MPGPFTLEQIVAQLGGRVAGDPQVLIRGVGSLERAGDGQIAFQEFRKLVKAMEAEAPIVGGSLDGHKPIKQVNIAQRPAANASESDD